MIRATSVFSLFCIQISHFWLPNSTFGFPVTSIENYHFRWNKAPSITSCGFWIRHIFFGTIGTILVPWDFGHRTMGINPSYHGNLRILVKNESISRKSQENTEISGSKIVRVRFDHNFRYKNPFFIILVPIESWEWGLSNGAKIMENGSLYPTFG